MPRCCDDRSDLLARFRYVSRFDFEIVVVFLYFLRFFWWHRLCIFSRTTSTTFWR